jgi:hypothetical protein
MNSEYITFEFFDARNVDWTWDWESNFEIRIPLHSYSKDDTYRPFCVAFKEKNIMDAVLKNQAFLKTSESFNKPLIPYKIALDYDPTVKVQRKSFFELKSTPKPPDYNKYEPYDYCCLIEKDNANRIFDILTNHFNPTQVNYLFLYISLDDLERIKQEYKYDFEGTFFREQIIAFSTN